MSKQALKNVILLFLIALLIRLSFYWIGTRYLPHNFQKFVTADTVFYYDPLALQAPHSNSGDSLLLNATRVTFIRYLTLFYRIFGHQHWPVSIFHCFMGALSIALLFLSANLFLKDGAAFTVSLVAALHPVLVYWAPFVTTETSFLLLLSLSILFFSLLIKTQKAIYIIPLMGCLAITSISRPLGISFFLCMALYIEWLILKKVSRRKAILLFLFGNTVFMVTLIGAVLRFNKTIDRVLLQPYPQQLLQMSLYLDQMADAQNGSGYLRVHAARLTLPPGVAILKTGTVPQLITVSDIAEYFRNHYGKYFALVISRIYTLFNPWVPEYSLRHNMLNTAFYSFIYFFTLLGLIHLWRIERDFAMLIYVSLWSQVLLISLTLVDYDFRLRLPLEFFMTIPCGVGLHRLLTIKKHSF